jgi:hypothetical protein
MPLPFIKHWVYPYGFSNSALDLVEGLNGRLIKRKGSRYVNKPTHTVINWGSARRPDVLRGVNVLNDFDAVRIATSKLATFAALTRAKVPHVEVTTSLGEARAWNARHKVLGRDLDHGSQGRGITVYQPGELNKEHKFYTKYYRKERELRIHVFQGRVIFEQEKLKKNGADNADKYVRSHDRGWCFAFHHLVDKPVPQTVRDLAVQAVQSLGLDFGAVDVGWNNRNGPRVFEVNTAPGIEETSLKAYLGAFNGQ